MEAGLSQEGTMDYPVCRRRSRMQRRGMRCRAVAVGREEHRGVVVRAAPDPTGHLRDGGERMHTLHPLRGTACGLVDRCA